jgi:hypothetical protein
LELHALTDQAGAIVAEILCQSGHNQWKLVSMKSVNYDVRELWQLWLMLLLHMPPLCFFCWAKRSDGRKWPALSPLGDSEIAVWIDNYPQVCVSALAWLKPHSPAVDDRQRTPKKFTPLRNAARDAWVSKQRSKKNPLSWEEIYDDAVRLAVKRGWDMPATPKALEEAHRHYLKRQRKAGKA